MGSQFVKDPNAILDYQWDWSAWLTGGETIASITVTAQTGITLVSSTNTTTTATAILSGGTAGVEYTVACKITTNSSPARVDERTITIKVMER